MSKIDYLKEETFYDAMNINENITVDFIKKTILEKTTTFLALKENTLFLKKGKKIERKYIKNNVHVDLKNFFKEAFDFKEVKSVVADNFNTGKLTFTDGSSLSVKKENKINFIYTRRNNG